MQRVADGWRAEGATVGVVPTMGALHAGHERLLRTARRECDRTVMTLFVNPTQFGPREDLARYPRSPAKDKALARDIGIDVVFAPAVEAMYAEGFATTVHVAGLTDAWEGAARPAHFDGVTTVVSKLFNITRPHRAYFGQKDAQQAAIVRRLAADLDFGCRVRVCPTVREPDGLALSSRNVYLSPVEREQATCLYEALCAARDLARAGTTRAAALTRAMRHTIRRRTLAELEYAAVVNAETMEKLSDIGEGPALAVVAVRFGGTRLIDNMPLPPPTTRRAARARATG